MTRINEFQNHLDETVEGQFLLSEASVQLTRDGQRRYKQLHLEDATGENFAYVWESSALLDRVPYFTPVPVLASVHLRMLNNEVVADLRAIRQLVEHEIDNSAVLLPFYDCPEPARAALAKLVEFNESLSQPYLREFLNRVLLDSRIGPMLLTCRGSQNHHHNQPGGLLIHSMDVYAIATAMIRGRVTDMECSITQMAAILHDLGKLRSVGTDHVRPVPAKLVRHETQTNRLLEPHLAWLRARDERVAAGLEYILDFLSQTRAERGYGKFVGADAVVYADHLSTAIERGKTLNYLLKGMPLAKMEEASNVIAMPTNEASIPWHGGA